MDRVTGIKEFARPETKKHLKRFLGMINFYHRFVPHAAALLAPLHDLAAADDPPRSTKVAWTPETDAAFRPTQPRPLLLTPPRSPTQSGMHSSA